MKRCLLILVIFLFIGCYRNPTDSIQRLARSDKLEDKEKASNEYKKVINYMFDIYSSYAGLNRDIGYRMMIHQFYKPAIEHFKIAINLKSNDASSYFWIGLCYANLYKDTKEMEFLEEVEKYYTTALNITPNNKEYIYAYCQLLVFSLNRYDEAIEILKNYVYNLTNEMEPKGYLLRARTYYMVEDYESSFKAYNEIYNKFQKKLSKLELEQLNEFIRTTGELVKR
jgi:tetratricopeptide (TPR) repeat protein